MNSFSKKNVFISGGAGVIGSVLTQQLHQQGARLFVGDLKPRPQDWPNEIIYREGDLNEVRKDELLEFEPEYYFHLAATFERSEETYEFWDDNFHHNVKLSHYLLDCLKDAKSLKKIVFASSYLIYDPRRYLYSRPPEKAMCLSEESTIYPRNLCGTAKLQHEQELEFVRSFNRERLSVINARIFRSYGRNSRDIISRWIRSLIRKETIIAYSTEGAFDFIFADDVAEGLLRLALSEHSGIVNLGNGRARKIADVLTILKGHFPEMKVVEEISDIPYEASEADMAFFQKLTGWMPTHQLEEAMPLIIDHERKLMS